MAISTNLALKIFVGTSAVAGSTYLVLDHYMKNNSVAVRKVNLLDDARNEFMDRVWNGITWKKLIDFMEKEENKKLFGELNSTKAVESTTKTKAKEFLDNLEEFLCALEEYNILNVLELNIKELNELVNLVGELKNDGSMEEGKISKVPKLFDSVYREIKAINNYSSFL